MQITVIGAGYVGLVTGACFAEFGVDVTCVDKDVDRIASLTAGKVPIYEPGLEKLVLKNMASGRLRFTTDIKEGIEHGLVIFIAVGTPPKDNGSPNLDYVNAAAKSIAEYMNEYKVIVTKSTVPVGNGKRLKHLIQEHQKNRHSFGIVSNPEFLREGAAISDFMEPDRVVIGSDDTPAVEVMRDLYRSLYTPETPFIVTSLEAAELSKYAANAFLATKISFINEIANLCDRVKCDVHDVARAMGLDPRIGKEFLHPGPGYGGSCFPKDTDALASVAREFDCESLIIEAVMRVNRNQREVMLSKIEKLVGDMTGKTIAVLGLSFKPETDDMREAPSLDIIRGLVSRGARVRAFDPAATNEAKKFLKDIVIDYAEDEYAAVAGADALVFLTEWNQFKRLDMVKVKKAMKSANIADLRNICNPEDMDELGFQYVGVGRQAVQEK